MTIPSESSVYAITCLETNDVYIGSSRKVALRWNGHRFDLKRNRHANQKLQDDWNRYGEAAFSFRVIETLVTPTKAELRKVEAVWVEQIGTYNRWIARDGTFVPDSALREAMRAGVTKRWKDGDPALIAGNIKALGAAHMGHSERLKARWRDDPEYAAKMIAVSKAVLTPEHQKAATEKRWAQEGAHEQQSAKLTEAWNTREKKSGLPRGVSHLKDGRFKASLWKDGKTKHIGCYDTIEQAAAAYQLAIAG